MKKSPYIGGNGHYYTNQLFKERAMELVSTVKSIDPPFTLFREAEGFIPFGKRYVECMDPSGYKITQKLLYGDYAHWMALMKSAWFREAKEEWDREIEAKLFAEGMDAVRDIQKDEEAPASVRLQAARLLVQKGYKEKIPNRGRPSKEEVQGELKRAAQEANTVDKDMDRIRAVK